MCPVATYRYCYNLCWGSLSCPKARVAPCGCLNGPCGSVWWCYHTEQHGATRKAAPTGANKKQTNHKERRSFTDHNFEIGRCHRCKGMAVIRPPFTQERGAGVLLGARLSLAAVAGNEKRPSGVALPKKGTKA